MLRLLSPQLLQVINPNPNPYPNPYPNPNPNPNPVAKPEQEEGRGRGAASSLAALEGRARRSSVELMRGAYRAFKE
mgnify:CR=1 FL=1